MSKRSEKPHLPWDGVVGVIGLGQTGLPLALAFARAGVPTAGFDLDAERVEDLRRHRSYLPDLPSEEIRSVEGRMSVDTDPAVLGRATAYVICVPTPVDEAGAADLSFVDAAANTVADLLRPGVLVALQSTVPPGTTAQMADRLRRRSGLIPGSDFHLVIAPERIDPANGGSWTLANTPKLVGGLTATCTRLGVALFSQVVDSIVAVDNPEVAEVAKVYENTFRLVNIALTYEITEICDRMGVSARSVIEAAATKPYGFLAHYPGPGIGGECIPVDPLFLTSVAAREGFALPLVAAAHQHVVQRPHKVVDRLTGLLRDHGGDLAGSRVLIVGASYKPGVADIRNAPALDIIRELKRRFAKPRYTDPYLPELVVDGEQVERVDWDRASAADHDCVVLVTPHEQIMQRPLWYAAPMVLDTWQLLPTGDGIHHL